MLKVKTNTLLNALKEIGGSVSDSSVNEALASILIEVKNNTMEMTASNEFVQSQITIEVKSDQEQRILVPADTLKNQVAMVSSLGDEEISISITKSELILKSRYVNKSKIPLIDPGAYPVREIFKDAFIEFDINNQSLYQIANSTCKPSINTDTDKLMTKVIHFDFQLLPSKEQMDLTVVSFNMYVQATSRYLINVLNFNELKAQEYQTKNKLDGLSINLRASTFSKCFMMYASSCETSKVMISEKKVLIITSTGAKHIFTQSSPEYIPFKDIQSRILPPFLQVRAKTTDLISRIRACSKVAHEQILAFSEKKLDVFQFQASGAGKNAKCALGIEADLIFRDLAYIPEGYSDEQLEQYAAQCERMKKSKTACMQEHLFKIKFATHILQYIENYSSSKFIKLDFGSNEGIVRIVPLEPCGSKASNMKLFITPMKMGESQKEENNATSNDTKKES